MMVDATEVFGCYEKDIKCFTVHNGIKCFDNGKIKCKDIIDLLCKLNDMSLFQMNISDIVSIENNCGSLTLNVAYESTEVIYAVETLWGLLYGDEFLYTQNNSKLI